MTASNSTIQGFTKVDGPEFPKVSTNHYLTNQTKLKSIQEAIENSICFGQLGKGIFGKKSGIAINSMDYGGAVNVPFFTEYRTARDANGDSLSCSYQFDKHGVPINLFLLVKTPWRYLIQRDSGLYSVKGYLRSPDKKVLPRVESELVNILEKNQINFQ